MKERKDEGKKEKEGWVDEGMRMDEGGNDVWMKKCGDGGKREWRDERMRGWRDEGVSGGGDEGMRDQRMNNEGMKGWREKRIKGRRDKEMSFAVVCQVTEGMQI